MSFWKMARASTRKTETSTVPTTSTSIVVTDKPLPVPVPEPTLESIKPLPVPVSTPVLESELIPEPELYDPTDGPDSNTVPEPVPKSDRYNRPGTAGTEAALKLSLAQASERYKQAQKAKRSYQTQKRSAAATADYAEAKEHFRQAAAHLRSGLKLTASVLRSMPYIIRAKRERATSGKTEKGKKELPHAQHAVEEDDDVLGDGYGEEQEEHDRRQSESGKQMEASA